MSSESLLDALNIGLLVYDKRELITINNNATVEQALQVMNTHNILSLPVVNPESGKCEGILSMLDLMLFVSFGCYRPSDSYDPNPDQFQCFKQTQTPVGEVAGIDKEGLWEFDASESIMKILEPMSKGVHRILVHEEIEEDGKKVKRTRLLTQTDLIRFLVSYTVYAKDINCKIDIHDTLENLGLASASRPEPFVVSHTLSALESFRRMAEHDVKSAPVVDDNGVLLGTISASDLRGLRSNQLPNILLSVLEFKDKARSLRQSSGARPNVVKASPSSTLFDTMVQLIIHKVHQLWLVNADGKPTGSVSMTDIITKFSAYDHFKQ